jgi:hypothetical protein
LYLINDRFEQTKTFYSFLLDDLDNCVWHHGNGSPSYQIPEEDKAIFPKAIELCRVLSKNFSYVRIDWYIVKGRLYFGEFTFTTGSGTDNFYGTELEKKMFKYWVL